MGFDERLEVFKAADAEFDDAIEDAGGHGDADAVGGGDLTAEWTDFHFVNTAFNHQDATLLLSVGEVVVARAEIVVGARLGDLLRGGEKGTLICLSCRECSSHLVE